jgi:hypothetical protein
MDLSAGPGPSSKRDFGFVFFIAFGSLFAAAGLGVLGFRLPGALARGEAEPTTAASVVGGVFTFVGAGIIWLGFYSRRTAKQRADRVERYPNSPWLWNPEWAQREIKGNTAPVVIFLWVFAGIWNAIAWPIVPQLMDQIGRGHHGAAIGLMFPAIGAALVVAALHATLRARRFGRSVFVLDSLPGVIGGELVGTVRISKTLPETSGLRVRLVCVNCVTRGSGKNSSTSEHVLYEDKQEIASHAVRPGPRGSEIPLQFQIPFENPDSDDTNPRSTIGWRIELHGDFAGIDYATQFEIPVFKTAASSAEVGEPKLAPAQLDEALAGQGALADSRVQVTALPDGGVALYFPAARNKGTAFALSVFAGLWGCATWFIATRSDAPFLMTGVFGFFEVLLLVGVLTLWCASTRVRASRAGLAIKGGLFGLGREKMIAAGAVEAVSIETGLQHGSKVYYRLRARHGRSATGCGSGIPDRAEAAAFSALLERALGVRSD